MTIVTAVRVLICDAVRLPRHDRQPGRRPGLEPTDDVGGVADADPWQEKASHPLEELERSQIRERLSQPVTGLEHATRVRPVGVVHQNQLSSVALSDQPRRCVTRWWWRHSSTIRWRLVLPPFSQ